MSLEWLLTKAVEAQAKEKSSKRPHEEDLFSDNVPGSKLEEPNQETESGKQQRQRKSDYIPSAKTHHRHPEIELRCDCGYIGTVAEGKKDFKLLRTGKKGLSYFECSNCRRHLQYNSSTGEVKTQKGFLGLLFRRFS